MKMVKIMVNFMVFIVVGNSLKEKTKRINMVCFFMIYHGKFMADSGLQWVLMVNG
jgi:hypothetical protein